MTAARRPILLESRRRRLTVRDLDVGSDRRRRVAAVKGVSFDVSPGETLAIVGESGSGKSQTMMAVMGLLASNGFADRLRQRIAARRSSACRRASSTAIRGAKLGMIFQEPMTSLDPLYRDRRPARRAADRARAGCPRRGAAQRARSSC